MQKRMNFLSSDGDGSAFSKNSFGRFGKLPNNADSIAACTGVFLFQIDLIALACPLSDIRRGKLGHPYFPFRLLICPFVPSMTENFIPTHAR
jgi:hypothetical protein